MEVLILLVFLVGYGAIVLEHSLKIDKASSALVMGILSWTIYILSVGNGREDAVLSQLNGEMSEAAGILFFLIGAMTIVEVIDLHDGFRFITDRIRTHSKRRLLWIISLITFFLSAILDNLTTTIVMVSLLSRLVDKREDRLLFVSTVIIAANAGGAWTPMGDVTTTMLWIGKQVSSGSVISKLFLPSMLSMLLPLAVISLSLKGDLPPRKDEAGQQHRSLPVRVRNSVFFLGVGLLICTPVFKALTGLPPYAGMMLSVGILWAYTGLLYGKKRYERLKERFSVTKALHKVEFSTILFFFGILLCIGAMEQTGILSVMAAKLNAFISNQNLTVTLIGLASSVIDNVPLVAAAQGMFSFPLDNQFWLFLAYAAGTGGSILVIGSAAGVAAMGMEKIDFFWYLKRIGGWALLGYLFGALAFVVCSTF